jgi:predicted transcriptional regulator
MRDVASDLDRFFGALEIRVLGALWIRDTPQSVRDLQPSFHGVAYTTLMTTLDRLHRKGVLLREKSGRAFVYRPRLTRDELVADLAGNALEAAFGARADELRPILSFFVETVSRADRESLAALERLVAERRGAARRTSPADADSEDERP